MPNCANSKINDVVENIICLFLFLKVKIAKQFNKIEIIENIEN